MANHKSKMFCDTDKLKLAKANLRQLGKGLSIENVLNKKLNSGESSISQTNIAISNHLKFDKKYLINPRISFF